MTHCHGQNRNVHAKYIVILNATKAATKAKIYRWTNSRERVQHIQKKNTHTLYSEFIHKMRVFLWMQSAHELDVWNRRVQIL